MTTSPSKPAPPRHLQISGVDANFDGKLPPEANGRIAGSRSWGRIDRSSCIDPSKMKTFGSEYHREVVEAGFDPQAQADRPCNC